MINLGDREDLRSMRGALSQISGLLREWLAGAPAGRVPAMGARSRDSARRAWPIHGEAYEVENRAGHSVLFGRFQVGNQIIRIAHSQWDGDSYPMNLQQRKDILRMTILERIRKRSPISSKLS